MKCGVVSLFPQMFDALHHGITGRAIERGLLDLAYYNPRDYSQDKHRSVDDRPYGGGPGMVMTVQPLRDSITAAKQDLPQAAVILLCPKGQPLTQAHCAKLALQPEIILLNGRYEGIDERVITRYVDTRYSLGDFVISGGECASLVLIDAITRLLPGALGDAQSAAQDSFSNGLLDHPHYTRPACIDGLSVPTVLQSGDHQAIAKWRSVQAQHETRTLRPDLLNKAN